MVSVGLTSSAVSKQVLNLESELRTKLLNRTTRKVSLTEEGALFFSRASRAMEDIAEAREQMNELKTTPRGQLRISVPTALGAQYLKKPIAEFAVKYPEVTLDVQFEDRLIDIAEEGFDLVLRIAEAHGGKVQVTSEPGKGSTFTLMLPSVPDRAAADYVGADLQTRPNA